MKSPERKYLFFINKRNVIRIKKRVIVSGLAILAALKKAGKIRMDKALIILKDLENPRTPVIIYQIAESIKMKTDEIISALLFVQPAKLKICPYRK